MKLSEIHVGDRFTLWPDHGHVFTARMRYGELVYLSVDGHSLHYASPDWTVYPTPESTERKHDPRFFMDDHDEAMGELLKVIGLVLTAACVLGFLVWWLL